MKQKWKGYAWHLLVYLYSFITFGSLQPRQTPCIMASWTLISLVQWVIIYLWSYSLTLNCIRYPALPLVHNGGGGSMEPPQRKPLSHRNFLIIFTPYVYTLITTIFQEKKYKIFVPFQNGGQITDFHFASFRFRPKFEKPLSQRNFSMKCGSN